MVPPYINSEMATARKNYRFILSKILDFYLIVNLSLAIYALLMCILTLLSVEEILLAISSFKNSL